jgi:omega-6 fatty acid desaturase (delta-12 desaturase)
LVLPEVLKLFTAGIEYHHIHHLSSRVPSYRLRACHEEAPLGMWDGIQTMTMRNGWDALQLTLWSDVKEKLVSFTELDKEILLA